MNDDIFLDESVADLERLHKKLSERIDKLIAARKGIRATLDALSKPVQPQLFPLNGSNGHTDRNILVVDDLQDMPNTEVIAAFLASLPPGEFTTATAFKEFNRVCPNRLSKRQFQAAFRKVHEWSDRPLILVRERPGTLPNVYRWKQAAPKATRS